MEPRYIERLLHGKRWDKNRDRTILLVIEKTRYIETRYRELRLYYLKKIFICLRFYSVKFNKTISCKPYFLKECFYYALRIKSPKIFPFGFFGCCIVHIIWTMSMLHGQCPRKSTLQPSKVIKQPRQQLSFTLQKTKVNKTWDERNQ